MTRSEQLIGSGVALRALFVAIAAREQSDVARLLTQSPELARQAALVGATRAEAKAYYFEEISHYAYAGDTALPYRRGSVRGRCRPRARLERC